MIYIMYLNVLNSKEKELNCAEFFLTKMKMLVKSCIINSASYKFKDGGNLLSTADVESNHLVLGGIKE